MSSNRSTRDSHQRLIDSGVGADDDAYPMEALCDADTTERGSYNAPSRVTTMDDDSTTKDRSSAQMPQPSAPPAPPEATEAPERNVRQSGRSREQIERLRMARLQEDDEDEHDWGSKAVQYPDIDTPELYPPDYTPPPLLEALREAHVTSAEELAAQCIAKAEQDMRAGRYDKYDVTVEDAATILMYTAECTGEAAPYRVINHALETRDPVLLRQARHLVWKLLAALRKLPRTYVQSLSRGVNRVVDHHKGELVCWHRFSSTTRDMEVMQAFMRDEARATSGPTGTVYLIPGARCGGYDVRAFSFFPSEEELLLEPEHVFEVSSTFNSPSVRLVQLDLRTSAPLLRRRLALAGEGPRASAVLPLLVDKNLPCSQVEAVAGSARYDRVQLRWKSVLELLPDSMRRGAHYEVVVRPLGSLVVPTPVYDGVQCAATVTALMPCTHYQARCRVCSGGNVGEWATCEFATLPVPDLAMRVRPGTLTYTGACLEWNDVVDRGLASTARQEQAYTLQCAVDDGPFAEVATTPDPWYDSQGLAAGTTYRYRVKLVLVDAQQNRAESNYSPVLVVRPRLFPVPALRTVYVAYSSACVSWAIPPEYEDVGAGVFCVEVAGGAGGDDFHEVYRGPDTSSCLENLTPSTSYRIRACYIAGGRTGPWSDTLVLLTCRLPPAEVVLDPVDAAGAQGQPHMVCHVTTRVADYVAPQQLASVRYEYALQQKHQCADQCRSTVTSSATFSSALEASTTYKLRCRVLVGDEAGPWSPEQLIRTPEPPAARQARLIGGHALWAWEALFYVLAVVLLACFGEYLDTGRTAPATAALVLMLLYEASLGAYPFVVHKHRRWAQPPFLQLLFQPLCLTKGLPRKGPLRSAGHVYGVLLGVHWLLVLVALVLALLRVNEATGATWYASALVLALACTVLPALALPVLFWASCKGRRALLFVALFLLPPTGPLLYAAARADGALINWMYPQIFATMFAGIVFVAVHAVAVLVATQSARVCLFSVPFFVLVCIPTYIVLTVVVGNVMDSNYISTFTKGFAPLYIDCILLFLVSAVCHFSGKHKAVRHFLEDQGVQLQTLCCVPQQEDDGTDNTKDAKI